MPARHVVTVDKYQRMVDAGVFTDERVELVRGEIVDMSPIGSAHQSCVMRLTSLFAPLAVAERALVLVQGAIRANDMSQPQPDLVLLRHRGDFYAAGHPEPGDVLLVIEVADTSARYDRLTKMPLYAEAGVPEAWLVDLNGGLVDVARKPSPGGYGSLVRHEKADDTISPAAFPDVTLAVRDVLGLAEG